MNRGQDPCSQGTSIQLQTYELKKVSQDGDVRSQGYKVTVLGGTRAIRAGISEEVTLVMSGSQQWFSKEGWNGLAGGEGTAEAK